MTRTWIGLALLGYIAGAQSACYTAPARSSGPSQGGGVQMEIVGQDCDDYDEPDNAGFEAVQLRMRVAVTNRRSEAVVFDPDRLRLVAPDSVRPSPVAADSPFTLQPGETKIAGVRFMNRGSLKCAQEMKLDPSDSLTNGHRPVEVPPIAFVAHEKH